MKNKKIETFWKSEKTGPEKVFYSKQWKSQGFSKFSGILKKVFQKSFFFAPGQKWKNGPRKKFFLFKTVKIAGVFGILGNFEKFSKKVIFAPGQ